jgi:hypothetical protein
MIKDRILNFLFGCKCNSCGIRAKVFYNTLDDQSQRDCQCKNIEMGAIIMVYDSKLGTRCIKCKRLLISNKGHTWWRRLKAYLFYKT